MVARRYVTLDVFTDTRFGGNPLAVVLEAEGLSDAAMQAIAREFNYSETTFVLPPENPAHTARVRIFTPEEEIPFAGHPNVGTAVALARRPGAAQAESYTFEEKAGLVPVRLLRQGGAVVGAELAAPEPFSLEPVPDAALIARCLSLAPEEIAAPPALPSVGLPFCVVELCDTGALGRAQADPAAFAALRLPAGRRAIYACVPEGPEGLHARCFIRGAYEDPATGSATAAATAWWLHRRGGDSLTLRVRQGEAMGRPSLLLARAERVSGEIRAWVGGSCVSVMEGVIEN
ncbi:PhzF family phenazine biosynthesis protein [Roseomonas sp. GC11]|uniref:PhzF family phenazine biosynthesis protein n=1 Tax=Roseomonas sp. GC11 TaxID=2950546 RepID=UPI00210DDBB6|nr:PhzF family phenazine biosynthesis protein [Roseomonas sp. GC11]MCQ4161095.1 PhzF family phenazine biosynthesis protein [Roseomonas sp. GC11]